MISFPGKCCRAWNNLPPLVSQKRVYELQSSFYEPHREGQLVAAAGPYSFSPNAAVALNEMDARLPMGDQFAVLAAPTTHKAVLGLEVKSVAGCSYLLENGKLVFRKVHPPTSFMQTTAVRI